MYGKFERKKRLTSIVDLLFKEFPLNEFESHLGPGEHSLGDLICICNEAIGVDPEVSINFENESNAITPNF